MSNINFKNRSQSFVEKKFLIQTLTQEGKELAIKQKAALNEHLKKRTGKTIAAIKATVSEDGNGARLSMQHLKRQRFLDMKPKRGLRKRAYPIHNKILFNHLGNIIRELKFGFTESVRQNLSQLENNG